MGYEFEIARQAAQADLDEINELLSQREAAAPASEWTPPAPVPVQQRRTRAVEPRQAQPHYTGVDWEATGRWVQQHIDQRVGTRTREFVAEVTTAIATEAGGICGELRVQIERQAEKIAALEARLDAEIRAAQDARIAALEARLAEAEARALPKPGRPQLVIGGEA